MIKPNWRNTLLCIAILLLANSCNENKEEGFQNTLFENLPSEITGIKFTNQLSESESFNIIEYLYYYNGGGVAVGDINNDGLPDIYFTGNEKLNELYLNKGNFQFENITEKAGVAGERDWTTGVTMADVNGDGLLDIYVCYVGGYKGLQGRNQLFINQGLKDGTPQFEEKAAAYGIDFQGFSTQAAFFDYDVDGDLDMYLLNHSVHSANNRDNRESIMKKGRNDQAGDRLYKNENGKFIDVSEQAGIIGTQIGYGLSVSISDLNKDGFPDIYVCNDFHENDYLYYNNGNGTFKENIQNVIEHTSNFSMGSDISDINNDGLADIFTLDMKPEDEIILKKSQSADPYTIYQLKHSFGYQYQFPRNNLQLNQGDEFSEIGQLSGVAATDWSWGALFADLDNDGWKDLYITNGILRRPNDMDYLNYLSMGQVQRQASDLEIAMNMPEGAVENYAYRNTQDLKFENVGRKWGLATKGISNGSAYADLDNDGDLDLVVNNLNAVASIFKNNLDEQRKTNFLKIKLEGISPNTNGVGAKVYVFNNDKMQYQEHFSVRGWQSSVENTLHFGFENEVNQNKIDSIQIIWQTGESQLLTDVMMDQTMTVKQTEANQKGIQSSNDKALAYKNLTATFPITFEHRENEFVDFDSEKLMPFMLSTQGARITSGDLDLDGNMDAYFFGAARGYPAQLIIQKGEGFEISSAPIFEKDKETENVDATFFDADGDGDSDLYVVNGGNEKGNLQDALYLNDGKGNFITTELPKFEVNGACVATADMDADGDIDIFVGSRSVVGSYGITPQSYVLENDGKGRFSVAATLKLGMVTDAIWVDRDDNEILDLVVVGDWMPITVFENVKTTNLELNKAIFPFSKTTTGWWNTIVAGDFNKDSKMDFIVGNVGTNSNLQPTIKEPLTMITADFDKNGSTEPILSYYRQGRAYPFASKDEIIGQMAGLRKQYIKHSDYAAVEFKDLFAKEKNHNITPKTVTTFETSIFLSTSKGYERKALPIMTQTAPVFAILLRDINKDGNLDVLLGGNLYGVQPKIGRFDASDLSILYGNGNGDFEFGGAISTNTEIRSIVSCQWNNREVYLISSINGKLEVLEW